MPSANQLRERTMRYSIADGSLWAVMNSIVSSFLTPFALAINAPILYISALSGFPSLLFGVGQKIGGHAGGWGWKRKDTVAKVGFVHALAVLGISMVAFLAWCGLDFGMTSTLVLIFAACAYFFWGVGDSSWASLMGDVVPQEEKAVWFGKRNRVINAAGVVGLLAAGYFLGLMANNQLLGFAIVFLAAAIARFLSAYFLTLHWDPNPTPLKSGEPPSGFLGYAAVCFLFMFAANFAGVFVPVYMLEVMKFGAFEYAVLMGMTSIMAILSAPHWGRLIDKYGAKKVMAAACTMHAIPMFMWLFISDFTGAFLAYTIGGIIWAGATNAAFIYVYESVEPRRVARTWGDSSLLWAVGGFAGAIAGGLFLDVMGPKDATSFLALLGLAALMRIMSGLAADVWLKEVRVPKAKASLGVLMAKIITVYPIKGIAYDVIGIGETISKRKKR